MCMKLLNTEIPRLPGVYLFKNRFDEIIYIGKAKSLKERVASYFTQRNLDWKIDALINEYEVIEHIVTHTEQDALLLEAQLIQAHTPKFNVLLKNGQPFIYLMFTKEKLPRCILIRNKKQKGIYFGPFLHKKHARNVYDYIMKTFSLYWCARKISGGCLNYHLGFCAGNCIDSFNEQLYLDRVSLAISLLKGNYAHSLKELQKKVAHYSEQFEFEKAKHLHEYVTNLENIFNALKIRYTISKYEKNVFQAVTPIWLKKEPDMFLGKKLQHLLALKKAPETIDCFDVSHFQSAEIVGSCVRFKHGIPDKDNFRRFRIRSLKKQNDYAALQEIVSRRYKNKDEIPDLVLIDGGKGQLNAVKNIIPHISCISLAKKEERLYSNEIEEELLLDIHSEAGKLLIALRDYAHHFAISYHRKRRFMKAF